MFLTEKKTTESKQPLVPLVQSVCPPPHGWYWSLSLLGRPRTKPAYTGNPSPHHLTDLPALCVRLHKIAGLLCYHLLSSGWNLPLKAGKLMRDPRGCGTCLCFLLPGRCLILPIFMGNLVGKKKKKANHCSAIFPLFMKFPSIGEYSPVIASNDVITVMYQQ